MTFVMGFDASHWDGTVEWTKVPSEYKFVFIKATEGGYIPDPLAGQHFTGAEGRLRSFYHFWRFGYSASQQANQFVAEIRKHGTPELPPVIDLEDIRAPKGTVLIPHIKVVLQIVEDAFGRKPIIYTAKWWTDPWLGDCSWLRDYPFWLAQYTYNPYKPVTYFPRGITKYLFHQWTDQAEIPGIAENDEDCDTFNGSLEELYAFAGVTPPMSIEAKVDLLWAAHPELHGG